MSVSLISIVLGVSLALTYQFFALRSQVRFARSPGAAQGVIFVAELMFRFAWVGVVLAATQRWTPLGTTTVAVSFVAVFVILQGYSLYLYARGRGPFDQECRLENAAC